MARSYRVLDTIKNVDCMRGMFQLSSHTSNTSIIQFPDPKFRKMYQRRIWKAAMLSRGLVGVVGVGGVRLRLQATWLDGWGIYSARVGGSELQALQYLQESSNVNVIELTNIGTKKSNQSTP
jgi:hypothetical protein